jgi:phosphomannomutase / phosphoglucomutase
MAEALANQPAPIPRSAVAPARQKAAKPAAASVDRSIFRAYDIRGVLGKTLDEGVARLIGQAVGSLMQEKGLREIVVGRDGRLSGPSLSAALIEGLRKTGCDVIDIGLAPTPLVYFATHHLNTGSGIAVTGSHNPPDYNGFKIMVGGETLSGDAITDLYARIAENRLKSDGRGGVQQMDMASDYISRVASDIQLERRMRVVIDCGNGVAGALAPALLDAIGADAEGLYCEVDGNFPNHHPDPSEPENLRDLITAVKRTGAELGLAFDGDGDRLGVVTRSGEIIYPDRLLMLFAQDVLARNPGATVIYDVKCTGHLSGHILRHGGSPIMWKTGHSLIKGKMRETEAELAGEMSGHFFFRERWFGFDDGIYAAARLLEILAADEREPEEILAELPKGVSTPELKIAMEEGEHYAFIERFQDKASFEGAKIATIDGIRADWPDGWGLVRCSNTTPSLVLRFDADNEQALKRIQDLFRKQLLAVDPGLKLPF